MVWKWNSLLASVNPPSNHPSSWPAPVGRVQSLANSKQPSNHTVDGSLKAGKLTSWGTGSWHPIIYRGPYIHPRWLLGEISTVVVGKWIPYPIRSDMKCEGFLPCFFRWKVHRFLAFLQEAMILFPTPQIHDSTNSETQNGATVNRSWKHPRSDDMWWYIIECQIYSHQVKAQVPSSFK